MRVYRLAKTLRAADLSGEGAKRAGGRWNLPGTPVLYTAESGALAILEVLQYADVQDIRNFSMLVLDLPDTASLRRIELNALPPGWNGFPYPSSTQELGQRWAEATSELVLRVPSAVYSQESNYLLNPHHPNFSVVRILEIQPFVFSERLFR